MLCKDERSAGESWAGEGETVAAKGPERRAGAFHDRDATESALVAAAVALTERDGVLSGLNLREVSDLAGVNRALVYQYFGSRRGLLRAALYQQAAANIQDAAEAEELRLPFRERVARFFWMTVRRPSPIRLVTTLILDGDERPKLMPRLGSAQELLAAEAESGELPVEDIDALQALVMSSVYGYSLYRNHLARQLGVPVEELDDRVARTLDQLTGGKQAARDRD